MNYAGLAAEFEKTFSGTKDYYGNFQPHYIDTLVMGRLAFAADPEVTSYKLELVASKIGGGTGRCPRCGCGCDGHA